MLNQCLPFSLLGLVLCFGCQGSKVEATTDHGAAMVGSWTSDHDDRLTIGPVRPESGRGEYRLDNGFVEKIHEYTVIKESTTSVQVRVFFASGGTEDREYVVDLDGDRLTEFLDFEGHSIWVAFHRHPAASD